MKHFWVHAERNRWYVGKFLVEGFDQTDAVHQFTDKYPHLTIAWVQQ